MQTHEQFKRQKPIRNTGKCLSSPTSSRKLTSSTAGDQADELVAVAPQPS